MYKFLFFFCFLCGQMCFSTSPANKIEDQKKALEKIEHLVTSSATQNTSSNRPDKPENPNERNIEQDPSNLPQDDNSQVYPEKASDNTSTFKHAFYKTMSILLGGLVLVFAAIWLFRRFGKGRFHTANNLRTIKVIEKRPISPKSILYLIEIGGHRILISESQFEVRRISELEWLENTKEGL